MNFKKTIKRLFIIFLWTALIFTLLYLPNFISYDKKSINIFTWGDILDSEVITDFEKETGIKVHLNYYSSNEELLVKLKATRASGYDLIIPSDYAVFRLIQENLLKELDRSKITFWNDLNPLLLGHFFDPSNRYSIPFGWEIFGLGIDQEFFSRRLIDPSWKLIFDKKIIDYKIAMINDPLEAILLAGLYLFNDAETLSIEDYQDIKQLLIEQSEWVEAYADFRADYFLATKNCPVAVASSSYIWRTKKLFPFIEFMIPKEGTFITIENFAIPINSKKEEYVYRLLNYLYRPESIAKHYQTYGFFPAALNAMDRLTLDEKEKTMIYSSRREFGRYYFFKMIFSGKQVRDLWVEVKSF